MFKEIAQEYYEEARAIREDLHRHPELSYKEYRTAELIEKKLTEYGVDSMERMFETGVVALIHGAKGPGKCIGVRADIDALPVTEETGIGFASENPGVMHACGHDIHITNLLTVAYILCKNRDKFPGTVKLIFQPAEEAANPDNPHAGAWNMVRCGVLENPKVDAMIGLHNNPAAEGHGTFGLRRGVCTSGFDLYRFDVYGKTAHGSQPHVGNDAILAVSQLIVLLQQVVSRNIDPLKTGILSVGTIQGGTRVNIIPEYATAGGCFRYYDNDTAKVIREHTLAIARGVEEVSGCRIEVTASTGYSCVENDDAMTELAEKALKEELGEDSCYYMDVPASGSEDFSEYHLVGGIPTTFLWMNTRPMEGHPVMPLHSSQWCPDDDILKYGAPAMAAIAVKYLNS